MLRWIWRTEHSRACRCARKTSVVHTITFLLACISFTHLVDVVLSLLALQDLILSYWVIEIIHFLYIAHNTSRSTHKAAVYNLSFLLFPRFAKFSFWNVFLLFTSTLIAYPFHLSIIILFFCFFVFSISWYILLLFLFSSGPFLSLRVITITPLCSGMFKAHSPTWEISWVSFVKLFPKMIRND